MFHQLKRVRHKILLSVFLALAAIGSVQTAVVFAFQSSPAIAGAQYDLIVLLIEKKSFDQVEPEWKKVLDLRLGAKYEGPVAESLLQIGYKLYEAKQIDLALKIIDESLSSVPFSNKSKYDILRLKAYLYKELGDLDNAIRTLRFANQLVGK